VTKRLVIFLFLVSLFLLACGGFPAPAAEPTAPPTTAPTEAAQPTNTPVPEPTARPEPTATPTTEAPSPTLEPTSTPEPTATPEPTTPPQPTLTPTTGPVVVFRDDFNGALGAGWSWVREDPTHWNLTDAPGSLRIILQPEGVPAANNLLLRSAPGGKFEIATLVRFTPTSNFQFAGLLVYQDDSNFVQFGRAFAGNFVGNGIYLDNIRSGDLVEPNYATATANQSQAYLRLRREGTMYTAYYSEDGANWTVIGQHTNRLTPSRVGLVAAQAYQAETTADFDHFTITTLP
jgi:beta-xylosidase